jgi:hypothetical protein
VRRLLSIIVMAMAATALFAAQEIAPLDPQESQAASESAQTPQAASEGTAADAAGKAPRFVYFTPARPASALDAEGNALLGALPEMLATSIAVRQPIARGASADSSKSVVTVAASPAAGGRVSITVTLTEGGTAVKTAVKEFRGRSLELGPLQGFVEETASLLAPLLGPTEVPTDIQKVMASEDFVETSREADYLRQLDKRWEFSLWMSGFLRLIDSSGMDSHGTYYFTVGVGPLIAEATWFFAHDMGVQLSFYFNQTDAFDFGGNSRGKASGIFLFPGIGFVYRTVGQISADYTVTLSAGVIHVSANNGDVRDKNNNVVIPYGSSTWSTISPRVRISPALVWCITPSIALKGGLALDLIAPNAFPWYDAPLGDLQFVSIGLAYRL